MHRNREIHCNCCQLQQTVRVDENHNGPVTLCTACLEHRGGNAEILFRRDAAHIEMYRRTLIEAEDDAERQSERAEDYRRRMKGAYRSREMVVRVLSEIHDLHYDTPKGCKCAKRGCQVLRLVTDEKINNLIRKYDAEQENLRNLRYTDEDIWTDEWDKIIDTPLVPTERPVVAEDGEGVG